MTDTSTTAAEPVAENTSAPEPQDNHNAAELHEQAAAAEPEAEAAEPEPAEAVEGEEAATEPEAKPKKKEDWRDRRFKQSTAQKHAAERERDAALAELAALKGTGEQPAPESQSNLTDAEITRRAAEIVAQNERAATLNSAIAAGEKEFGKTEFTEACNQLAEMGANDRPEFLQIVTGEENGHKVLQHLGENPDEAERILGLPPLKMAAAIARISVDLAKPAKAAPVSAAPAPIKTLDGRARPNPTPDKMNDAEFDEFFNAKMKNLRSR